MLSTLPFYFDRLWYYKLLISITLFMTGFILPLDKASALNLNEYRKVYISNHEPLKQAQLRVDIKSAETEIADDLFQTQLTLGPTWGLSLIDIGGLQIEDTTGQWNLGLTQNSAWGTQVTLEGFEYFDRLSSSVSINDRQYSLRLTQKIWKNPFGATDRFNYSAKKSEYLEAQYLHLNQKMNSCSRASELYLDTFSKQERYKIFLDFLEYAEKALKYAEAAYSKRITRKIDILSARTDYLNIQSKVEEAKLTLLNSKTQLVVEAEWKGGLHQLDSPSHLDVPLRTESLIFNTQAPHLNYELEAQKAKIHSLDHSLQASRFENRSDIELSLVGSRTEGIAATQAGFNNFTNDFVGVSLSWEIPVVNKTLNSRIAMATHELALAHRELERLHKDNRAKILNSTESIRASSSLIELSVKKIKMYFSQIEEAHRLLQAGKIEFENYISYRDAYQNELLNKIDLERQLYIEKTNLATLLRLDNLVCGESS